jgi:hypothetical protein
VEQLAPGLPLLDDPQIPGPTLTRCGAELLKIVRLLDGDAAPRAPYFVPSPQLLTPLGQSPVNRVRIVRDQRVQGRGERLIVQC